MSEVIVAEQQFQLVNIVEIVQTNLSKNFALIMKRLNHHDAMFKQFELNSHQEKTQNKNEAFRLEQEFLSHKSHVSDRLQELVEKIQFLQSDFSSLKSYASDNNGGVKQLSDQVLRTQQYFQQKLKQKQRETKEIIHHVKLLALEQNRLNDEISKKQNRIEAERIIKETEILKDKNNHFESELKIAHHKIEKMEILNEKAERMQAKKEVEIFKEIEDRVRKELKNNLNTPVVPNQTNPTSITMIYSGQKNNQSPSAGLGNFPATYTLDENADFEVPSNFQDSKRKASIYIEQNGNNGNPIRGNIDQYLQKWGEKMKSFELQLKELSENLKILNKSSGKKEFRENKQNSEGLKEKLNELKPEVVKLWAKLDTIDDRVSFNERKLQQKMKNINELTGIIKDNNVSRLEQKVKNMQTQIFTSLKEIKAKLEVKVNQADYDKYVKVMDERIVQINELIYLKSDKLEVKKALLFLEAKIKEIILVISQDQQNEKDALLTKKQLKCISCDKDLDKFSGVVSSPKGNWDGLPFKDHPPEILGRFGMTNFGSLSKKIKRLQNKDLPVLNKRGSNHSFQINS